MLILLQVMQLPDSSTQKPDYDTLQITHIIHQIAPAYITDQSHQLYQQVQLDDENISIEYQPNLTQYLNTYRFTQHKNDNYTQQYIYAALQYLNGIQLMFGIKQQRQQMKAMMALQTAHRYGCNEATIFIANAHKHGIFGYSKSSLIAINYYKQLFASWAVQASDAQPYQYNYNLYNIELEIGKDVDEYKMSKSQRQEIIINLIEHSQERILYGNIVASGTLTGTFGFDKDEIMSSKFAYMSARGDYQIYLDKDKNSIQQFLREQNNETDAKNKYHGIYERVGKEYLKRKNTQQNNTQQSTIKNKLQPVINKIKQILVGKIEPQNNDIQDIDIRYKKINVDKDTKKKLMKYYDNFTIDEINLFNYNDVIPLTKEGFYDAIIKLSKELSYTIYQNYKYFKIFNGLKNRNNATKEEVLSLLLWSNQTLIQQAARMFIDNTDKDIYLQTLRNNNGVVDQGYDAFYSQMSQVFQGNRAFKETCSRRGQSFGLLSYYLTGGDVIPDQVKDTSMNRNYARIMSLGAAYYGCHMGLTGLSFQAMQGYRPYKNPKLNQATLQPIKKEDENITNSMVVYPEPKQALMGFDIASQAGSFEASYYEALLLSRNVYEYSPKLNEETQWLYHKEFQNIGYQDIKEIPGLAKLLAEHACHAGHIGGQFLYGIMLYYGYGTETQDKIGSMEILQRSSNRIVVDQFFEKYVKDETRQLNRFTSSLIFALSGDETSLVNILKQIYMEDRQGENQIVGQEELLIELAYYLQNNKVSIQNQFGVKCSKNKAGCIFAITGINITQIKSAQKQHNLIEYLQNIITQDHSLDYYALFIGQKWLEDKYNKKLSQLMLSNQNKQNIVQNNFTVKQFVIQQLKHQNNNFGEAIYKCFIENQTFQQEINNFGQCYQISQVLNYIKGNQTFYINKLQTYQSRAGEEATHFTSKHLQQFNELIITLIKNIPDPFLNKLLSSQQLISQWNIQFDAQFAYLEPSDVRSMMQNQTEDGLEPSTLQILQQTDYMNDQTKIRNIQISTKAGNKYEDGFYAPQVESSNQLFDYSKLTVKNENDNQKFIMNIYVQYRNYIKYILIFIVVFSIVITLDCLRYKYSQKDQGLIDLDDLDDFLSEETDESTSDQN